MVVLTSKIGKRAQVSSAGLLETSLNQQKGQVRPADPTPPPQHGPDRERGQVRVMGRIYEHTNSVSFEILRFGGV